MFHRKINGLASRLMNSTVGENQLERAIREGRNHLFALKGCFVAIPSGRAESNGKGLSKVHSVHHSSRSRIKGSTDRARCAGIQVASSPSNDMARTTPANTNGSRGEA